MADSKKTNDLQDGNTIYRGPIAPWLIGENTPYEDAMVKAANEWWQAVEETAKLTEQDKPD